MDLSSKYPNCKVINHPLLEHKLTIVRNKETKSHEFRRVVKEISGLLAYEMTRDLKLESVPICTPVEKTEGRVISEDIIIAAIMRAGCGMLDGLLEMLPLAKAGHIGIYRDKNVKVTVEYYFRVPHEIEGKRILLADPLIATGDTVLAAIDRLKQYKVGPIRLACLLISPVGAERLLKQHPDVEVYTLCIERELDEAGYLLPGVGDAGDRLYGTR
jgi:uracil phosphoribosyltransferase